MYTVLELRVTLDHWCKLNIWVNGVKGHNNSNGTWSASNVPVNDGGTASFTATGYAPNEQQPDGSYGN